ncbi:uncharacterized protein LOC126967318 [Leptidea sinapis]|uniref:uncharacterized protein LOC126967318 n=1 Tax=Leptidea sinapis TaxID=189913 RepID=UPI0021C31B72|nr:uncharacterized protein LOC126967318 [Leptidea sinapis]
MVLTKCDKCKRNITKKVPGLVCSRCNVTVHADPACAKLSNKQLSTLRNSTSIEWSCDDCMKNVARRSSFITPEDDCEETESVTDHVINTQLDTQKLIQDISRELKKTFREEFGSLETSIEFLSDQLCTIEQSLKKQDVKIKELENKNLDLQNRNKNLELRVTVLEQETKSFHQKSLTSTLEIAGLPQTSVKDIGKVIETLATKLNTNVNDIMSSQRLPGPKDRPCTFLVEMKSKAAQRQWIDAGKEKRLTVGGLLPESPKEAAENRVFIREALTKYLKTLLYNTKTQLSKIAQFIWCKEGKICVRKGPNSKIYYVRTEKDIDHIQKQL